MRRNNYACFTCRRGFKHGGTEAEVRCPQCGQPVANMGAHFKVPPRHAGQQWRKVALLANAGVRFDRSSRSWLPERPVKSYAQAKRVATLLRASHDAALAGAASARPERPRPARRESHPKLGHAARRQSNARLALREARAALALARVRGDSDRIARIERQIALLTHHLDALLERERHRQ